jgi:hypothetical protein
MKKHFMTTLIFGCISAHLYAEMPVVLLDEPVQQKKQFTHKHSENKAHRQNKASNIEIKRSN